MANGINGSAVGGEKRSAELHEATSSIVQQASGVTSAKNADFAREPKRVRLDDDPATTTTTTTTTNGETTSTASAASVVDKKEQARARSGRQPRIRESRDDPLAAAGDDDDGAGGSEPRLPKKRCAVMFGYCGIGYSGLQVNNDVKTIEGDIFAALCQAGAVSKDNAVNPNKVHLQRAARTDRGVHAAGNLLSLKLILEPPDMQSGELLDRVNGLLPDCIRIWGFKRIQASFNARKSCDSREYEYMLPTYTLLPPKPGTHMYEMIQRWAEKEGRQGNTASATGEAQASLPSASSEEYEPTLHHLLHHPFWKQQGTDKSYEQDVQAKKRWRIPPKHLERVREIFKEYVGSHNFHNFTIGKPFRDRSARRHMLTLTISEPKIINNTEWLSIKFHGQSFMLHQIRKMIGLLIMMGRTTAPASLIPETFGPARIHVPKAPGLGLLLEQPLFTIYNKKLVETMTRQKEGPFSDAKGEGGVPKAEIKFSEYVDKVEKFKQEWIYDRITQEEDEKAEYIKFLQYLDVLVGNDFEYLNPKGIIPQNAILKVGETVRPAPPDGQSAGVAGQDDDDDDEDAKLLQENPEELEG